VKILIDTNVLLDAIVKRDPFYQEAQNIFNLILDNKVEGFITANSVTDIYYIARKTLNHDDLRNTMRSLFALFSIIDVLGDDCKKALDFPLEDYEDALLVVCCNKVLIDHIITRDKEFIDKSGSSVSVISPKELLRGIEKTPPAIS
jgi:predicted nucleic acid-binding protein